MTRFGGRGVPRQRIRLVLIKTGKLCLVWLATLATAFSLILGSDASQPSRNDSQVRFLAFEDVRETLALYVESGMAGTAVSDAADWDLWIREQDREVRARIDRGVEDSISNLILYGTSFTVLPRLEAPEAAVNSAGDLVEAARARVRMAPAALARPEVNERLRFASEYLTRRGVRPKDVEATLAANLTRFALEERAYQEKLKL